MIRLLLTFCLTATLVCAQTSAPQSAREAWVAGYEVMRAGEVAQNEGRLDEAISQYRGALNVFDAVQKNYPKWNAEMVAYRIRYCMEQIETLAEQQDLKRVPNRRSTQDQLRAHERQLQQAGATMQTLRDEISNLSKALDQARREAARAAEETRRAGELAAENETLRDRNSLLQDRIIEMAAIVEQREQDHGVDALRLEAAQAREALALAKEQQAASIGKLEAQLSELARKNRHLSIELESARKVDQQRTAATTEAAAGMEQLRLALADERAARRRATATSKVDQRTITSLRKHVDVLKAMIDDTTARLDEQTAILSKLKGNERMVAQHKLDLDARQQEIELLKAHSKRLEADMAAQQTEISELEDLLTALRDPDEESPEATILRKKVQDVYAKLQAETQLRTAAEFAKTQALLTIRDLETRVAGLEASLAANAPGEEISIEGEVVPAPASPGTLRVEQQELDHEAASLRTQIAELIGTIGTLPDAEKKRRLPLLRDQLNKLNARLGDLRERQAALDRKAQQNIRFAVGQVQDAQIAELAAQRADNKKMAVQLTQLEALLKNRDEDLEQAAKDAATLRRRLAEAKVETVRLQKIIDADAAPQLPDSVGLAGELKTVRRAYAGAREREALQQQRIDTLVASLAEQEAGYNALKAELTKQHQNVAEDIEAMRKDAAEAERLRQELADRDKQLDTVTRTNAKLRTVADELERRFESRMTELNKDRADFEQNRQRLEHLEAQNEELQAKYQAQVALSRAITEELQKQRAFLGTGSTPASAPLPADLQGYRELVQRLRQEQTTRAAELERLKNKTIQITAERDARSKELTDFRTELASSQDRADYRVTLLQKQIASLLEEVDVERSRGDELAKRLNQAGAIIPVPEPQEQELDQQARVQALLTDGASAQSQGKTEAARFHYQQALELDPANPTALRRQGQILVSVGDFANAADYLKQAFSQTPDDFDTLLLLGYALRQSNQLTLALSALTRAVALFPDRPDGHRGLAACYQALGWSPQAVDAQKQAFSLDTSDAQTAFQLAVYYTELTVPQMDDARRWYQTARELGAPEDPDLERILQARVAP